MLVWCGVVVCDERGRRCLTLNVVCLAGFLSGIAAAAAGGLLFEAPRLAHVSPSPPPPSQAHTVKTCCR